MTHRTTTQTPRLTRLTHGIAAAWTECNTASRLLFEYPQDRDAARRS